jgi:hypothetical protein
MIVLAGVCLAVALPSPSSAATRVQRGVAKAGFVSVAFSGSGGGRYLDTFRLTEQGGDNECYARQVADEDVSVSWTVRWAPGRAGARLPPAESKVVGSVTGTAVRDDCDNPEQADPLWSGTQSCDGTLRVARAATLSLLPRSDGRLSITVHAPTFVAPPLPCDLDIRNDQLVAHVVVSRARLARGETINVPVGTAAPGPGDDYLPTEVCTDIAHRYDGQIWSYDCSDTLTWAGTLSIRQTR